MKLVVFGLSVSSSWGNGHATLWRGLIRALARRGHRVVFFERDVPYYAAHRDLPTLPDGGLRLYAGWEDAADDARRELADADVGMVTSYCPDGPMASRAVLDSSIPRKVYYDLDSPVTLACSARQRPRHNVAWPLAHAELMVRPKMTTFTMPPPLHRAEGPPAP
ncbi:MAG TPA: hypothetical protein VF048_07470, partial [Gemmatimonadaceae bacterium]